MTVGTYHLNVEPPTITWTDYVHWQAIWLIVALP